MGKDYNIASYSGVSSAFERVKSRLLTDHKLEKKIAKITRKLDKGQREICPLYVAKRRGVLPL